MQRKLIALITITLFAILVNLPIINANPGHNHGGGGSAKDVLVLYLNGEDTLTTSQPTSSTSISISPGVYATMNHLSTWHSQKVAEEMNFSGSISFLFWAKGYDVLAVPQSQITFHVYIDKNGEENDMLMADGTLTSEPQKFEASGTIEFNLKPGDTISVSVYAQVGGLGGEFLIGSEEPPSHIVIGMKKTEVSVHVENPENILEIDGTITDLFSIEDIKEVEILLVGIFPDDSEDPVPHASHSSMVFADTKLDEQNLKKENNTIEFSWEYDYAENNKIKDGYYAVVVKGKDSANNTFSGYSYIQMKMPVKKSESPMEMYIVIGGLITAIAVGFVLYLVYKRSATPITKQRVMIASVISVVAIVVIAGISAFAYGSNKPTEKAPDFSLVDIDGKAFTLKDYRGKIVLLDMMATWCPSCKKLIPELKTLQSKYKELVIISIDVDPTETNEQLKEHKEEFGTTWIYALDTDGVARKYNVKSMPTVVIINPDGYITYFGEEFKTSAELSEIIDKTLKGQLGILSLGTEQSIALIAFLAGISAFFSPCAFPLLPGYMSYYLGRGQSQTTQPTPNYLPTEQEKQLQRKRTLRKALIGGIVASLGIITIYLLIGAIISLFGGEVKQYVGYIAPIVAIIIAILGFMMLTGYDTVFSKVAIALYPITNALKRPFGNVGKNLDEKEYTGLFAYGVGYGSASLGCHAPIFIAVVAMALISGGFFSAFGAFLAYAIGMGLLMIIVTVLIGMAKGEIVEKLRTWMPLIKKGSAIVLIVVGIYMTWYYMSVLSI